MTKIVERGDAIRFGPYTDGAAARYRVVSKLDIRLAVKDDFDSTAEKLNP